MVEIKLGSQTYIVRTVPERELFHDGQPHSGHVDHSQSTIDISSNWDYHGRHVIMWHELIHAILSHSGRDDERIGEDVIETLSYGIVEILQRNPYITTLDLVEDMT